MVPSRQFELSIIQSRPRSISNTLADIIRADILINISIQVFIDVCLSSDGELYVTFSACHLFTVDLTLTDTELHYRPTRKLRLHK